MRNLERISHTYDQTQSQEREVNYGENQYGWLYSGVCFQFRNARKFYASTSQLVCVTNARSAALLSNILQLEHFDRTVYELALSHVTDSAILRDARARANNIPVVPVDADFVEQCYCKCGKECTLKKPGHQVHWCGKLEKLKCQHPDCSRACGSFPVCLLPAANPRMNCKNMGIHEHAPKNSDNSGIEGVMMDISDQEAEKFLH